LGTIQDQVEYFRLGAARLREDARFGDDFFCFLLRGAGDDES